jgi:hypothetical protein
MYFSQPAKVNYHSHRSQDGGGDLTPAGPITSVPNLLMSAAGELGASDAGEIVSTAAAPPGREVLQGGRGQRRGAMRGGQERH